MCFDIDAHAKTMDKKADMLKKRLAEIEAGLEIATNDNETSYRKKDNIMEEKIAKEDLATYHETIFDIATVALERLEMLFRVSSNNSDVERICHIGEALIRDGQNLLNKGNDYIKKEFGDVAIRRICHGEIGFIAEEMICVDFKPADKEISRARAGERLNPGG